MTHARAEITLRRDQLTYTVSAENYTAEQIGRMFRLSPSDVWLRERYGNRLFFPNNEGRFDLSHAEDLLDLEVEGTARPSTTGTTAPPGTESNSTVTVTPSNPRNYSGFTPILAGRSRNYTLKVTQAVIDGRERNGRPKMTPVDQVYIDLTEATANVHHVNAFLKRELGEDYVVVGSDGFPVKDATATQGLRFWKASARKFFAVSLQHLTRKRSGEIGEPSNADEQHDLIEDVRDVRSQLNKLCSVTSDLKVPIGLKIALKQAFQCKICFLTPLKPPMIVTRCCKNVLGCKNCADTYYDEDIMSKVCPLCRCPRGYSDTMAMPPLDELLDAVRDAIAESDDEN